MLTERERNILDFIQREQREKGITPSTREIQRHFGFASQTAAVNHLRALKQLQQGRARLIGIVMNQVDGNLGGYDPRYRPGVPANG